MRYGVRHAVILLSFFMNVICYADRTNLSVALVPMAHEFGWDDAQSGSLLAAFFMGYIWTQIPGGMLTAHYGAKPVLIVGVVGWSVLTMLSPALARHSAGALFAASNE